MNFYRYIIERKSEEFSHINKSVNKCQSDSKKEEIIKIIDTKTWS